jgi:diguanylate cyclase (GGDEF)-like protein/PAS domain S-box-containing protein
MKTPVGCEEKARLDEIAALVLTLREIEQRLQELTAEQVDPLLHPGGPSQTLREAQEKLQESEERLRGLFAAAAIGIAVATPQGSYLQANAAYCRMLGYTEDELRTLNFASLTHPDDLSCNLKLRDELLAGHREGFFMEKRYLKKNGDILWTRDSVSATHAPGGEITSLMVIAEDITERKLAENALRQSEELLRLITNLVPHGIFAKDAAGRHIFANPALAELAGLSIEEILGKDDFDLVADKAQADAYRADDLAVLQSGNKMVISEEPRTDLSGRTRFLQTVKIPFTVAETGEKAVLGVCTDITERRQADENIREQAELLDNAQDAIYVVDFQRRVRYWNKGAERLYGWTSQEVLGRLATEILHDDASEINARVALVLKDGVWVGEGIQRRRDGSTLNVESRITMVKGHDDKPRSILFINTDITKRKAAEAKMERLAFYDTLTGLPNRQLLRERLDRALTIAARQKTTGAVLFIDLDDFKSLNDTLGHHIGDLLLQQVAIRLTSCIRKMDTVARLGGDEFIVLLEGLSADVKTAGATAKLVADKILGAFLLPFKLRGNETESTASIGITLFSGLSDTAEDLLKQSDLAMYRAKSTGRNALSFFDPEMQTYVTSRAALRADLRHAVQKNEFELFYQPQVNKDGQVISAEALLRWRHPQRGMVPPNEFIPLAEDAGLIVELGRWVLETACLQLSKWAKNPNMQHLSIAVNVSLRQLLDLHFVNLVLEALRKSGANPCKLKLEITESSMLEKLEDTIVKMEALKALGIEFSVDDFGIGYSSLSHLKRLPLSQLKVDRAFVKDLLTNDKDASIARTIITLGQNLNLTVIAEGVETEAQREFLERAGCSMYQGFLFSPALTSSKFEAFAVGTSVQA